MEKGRAAPSVSTAASAAAPADLDPEPGACPAEARRRREEARKAVDHDGHVLCGNQPVCRVHEERRDLLSDAASSRAARMAVETGKRSCLIVTLETAET